METNNLEIIPFSNEYSHDFRDLNLEWLEKYFHVEPYDYEVLGNPKENIIDKGGYIFFTKLNEQIVGTVALINSGDYYELSKMAVSPKYQGLKIGQKMLTYCIDFSKNKGWKNLILYSNRDLQTAIGIYKKYGFLEVPLEKDVHYERADIKMELIL